MKNFVGTVSFLFFITLALMISIIGAYFYLSPFGPEIGNTQLQSLAERYWWSVAPIAGIFFIGFVGLLNIIRRIFRIRQSYCLHIPTILLGLIPLLCFAWTLTGEPRFTAFARTLIDFVGRPLLLGTLIIFIGLFISWFFLGLVHSLKKILK